MEKIEQRLRAIEIGLGFTGAFLLFLDLVGFFQPRNRINLYLELVQKKVVTAQSSVAREALGYFAFPDQLLEQVESIQLVPVTIGTQGPPIAGEIQALSRDGRKKAFASLDGFHDWAYASSKAYRWLSFVLMVLALMCKGVGMLLSSVSERLKRPSSVPSLVSHV